MTAILSVESAYVALSTQCITSSATVMWLVPIASKGYVSADSVSVSPTMHHPRSVLIPYGTFPAEVITSRGVRACGQLHPINRLISHGFNGGRKAVREVRSEHRRAISGVGMCALFAGITSLVKAGGNGILHSSPKACTQRPLTLVLSVT